MEPIGLREQYERDGFVLVPSGLTASDIAEVRRLADAEFARAGGDYISTSQMLALPRIFRLLFLESVVRVLKEVLGSDFTLYPNFNVQKNSFGPPGLLHHDCDSEGRQAYLCQSDYRFVKCGIYLQDNDPEWGGGINVTPGTHLFPIRTGNLKVDFGVKRVRDTIRMKLGERRVNIKVGDLVVFDSRLPHSSTFPSRYKYEQCDYQRLRILPPERTKYVFYWDASSTLPYVGAFLRNSARRAEKEVAYANWLRFRYPESYPADFASAVERAGIQVAQLVRDEALLWEQRHQTVTAREATT